MIERILFEIISIAGTIITVLFVRWMMELSSPEEDLLMIERFVVRLVDTWKAGSFEQVMIWYRVRKLLDY